MFTSLVKDTVVCVSFVLYLPALSVCIHILICLQAIDLVMQHAPGVLVQYAQAVCGLDADKV